MNAPDRTFMTGVQPAARLLGGVAACVLLSGCMSYPVASTTVDAKSPVAADVARLATQDRDYPSFSEIPASPNDMRPLRMYGQQANQLLAARDDLNAATEPSTWTLNNTGAFAARAQREAGPDLSGASGADTAAFAEAMRKRATPPPPPKR